MLGKLVQLVAIRLLGGEADIPDKLVYDYEIDIGNKTELYSLDEILTNLGGSIKRPYRKFFGTLNGEKKRWDVRSEFPLPKPAFVYTVLEASHDKHLLDWQKGEFDTEELSLTRFQGRHYFVAALMALNALMALVARKYKLPQETRSGLIEGLRREVETLEVLVPFSKWTPDGRALIAEAFTQEWLDQEAAFAPIKITPGASTGAAERPDEESSGPREQRYDITRLLAHMKTEGYIGMRALPNRKKQDYSALTFRGPNEREALVLMDTPKVGNALYYYVGRLETLMALLLPLGDDFARAEALRPYQRGRTIHLGDWETRSRAKIALLRRNTADKSDN